MKLSRIVRASSPIVALAACLATAAAQSSGAGKYHFTDGCGNYRNSDDPNYAPEKAGEVGTWTPMTPAQ